MVRPGRERLSGQVQVDETYVGGPKPGKRGRGAAGKTLVVIAVEDITPNGIGRLRMGIIVDASGASLAEFVTANIEPGSTVITDGWTAYGALPAAGYQWSKMTSKDLKLPHLVASLMKRWILGTYQGAVKPSHLCYYLDEFTFRFNRRTSRHRGKLFYRLVQQAAGVHPVQGQDLKAIGPLPVDTDFDDIDF